MRIPALVAILAICSYANLSVQSYEESLQNPSLSVPRIQFSNNTQSNINGFIAYYYFTSAEPNPVFEPYYMEKGRGSIEHISGVNYRVKLDFSSVSLPAGSVFPNNSGISFGLHYANWASWTKNDDYSNNMSKTMASNNSIIVTSVNGQLLAGTYPNFNINIPTSQGNTMARVYALKEGENNFAKIRLYVKNEGKIALNHFDFSIEITAENGLQPILDTWYIPNTTYTIEQKNDSAWAFHFSTKGVSLEPNSVFPSYDGISFGIHYSNWAGVNTQNDYSLKGLQNKFSLVDKIPIYIDGKLVSGAPKINNISDINKILISESKFTQNDFNRSVESLLADIPEGDKKDFWDNMDIFFKDVPNYDSIPQAIEQIFAKFPSLDTLTLVSLWKDIKASYEQLVRLRIHEHYASAGTTSKKMSLAKSSYSPYASCGEESYFEVNSEEFWLIIGSLMSAPGTRRAKTYAEQWAAEYASKNNIKGSIWQNRADGFRHAVLNALLCRETGTQHDNINDCLEWAKKLTDAHESEDCNEPELDKPMDLHNNRIGREYYKPHLSVGCEWSIPIIGCVNHEVVGPSREDTKKMFFDLADRGYGFNEIYLLSNFPWLNSIVFYRPDSSEWQVYCNTKNTTDCIDFVLENRMQKIGLLKKNSSLYCADEVSFYMDLEDSDNRSRIISGDKNPPGIVLSSGGVRFTYCPVTVGDGGTYNSIPRVPYDYVVLRLSENCPEGTYPFRRYHDNEDSKNNNSHSGDLGPNSISDNSTLEYCFVPAQEDSDLEYPFSVSYGVFANYSSESIVHSEIYLDDEDSKNNNSWYFYNTPSDIETRVKNIMNGTSNTIYHVVSYIVIVFNAIVNFFIG